MRTMALLTAVVLAGATTAGAQWRPAPSRTLDLALAVDTIRSCVDAHGAEARVTVRLRVRNRGQGAMRVLPDTLRTTSVQFVRTVEELVPMGADTPGVSALTTRSAGRGAARLVEPGASVEIIRDLAVSLVHAPGTPGPALEPGHYFLELVALVEAASPGDRRFTVQSIVSPYVEVDLPPASQPCPAPSSRGPSS